MLRAAVLITSTLAVTGCVADSGGEGFVIVNNTAVTGTDCALSGIPGQPFVPHGQIFSGSPGGYLLTPLMQSQITATMDQELQRTIMFEGANISLTIEAITVQHPDGSFDRPTAPTLAAADGQFQALFSGSLPPGGTANVSFEVIPVASLAAITAASGGNVQTDHINVEVSALVKPFGTMGGSRVDGGPFKYPVTVCNDCVVNDLGACPIMGTIRTGNACNPFQDGPVDCCESGTSLICPAPAM